MGGHESRELSDVCHLLYNKRNYWVFDYKFSLVYNRMRLNLFQKQLG